MAKFMNFDTEFEIPTFVINGKTYKVANSARKFRHVMELQKEIASLKNEAGEVTGATSDQEEFQGDPARFFELIAAQLARMVDAPDDEFLDTPMAVVAAALRFCNEALSTDATPEGNVAGSSDGDPSST